MNTNKFSELEQYKNPAVTTDLLIFTLKDNTLQILLTKRDIEPFNDMWSLPGGFVAIDESVEAASHRVLQDKVGVDDFYLEQLYTFGDLDRDPRTRVITVAYFALIPYQDLPEKKLTSVSETKWFAIHDLPELAFDHKAIISYGVERLRNKIGYSTIVFGLLPHEFRLSELQAYYETILGQTLDKRNFRKKMLSLGFLVPTGKTYKEGAHRPAKLYTFKKREVVLF